MNFRNVLRFERYNDFIMKSIEMYKCIYHRETFNRGQGTLKILICPI